MKRTLHGQSLVEIIVVIGVVILLVTGLVSATTASLQFTQRSKKRAQGLSYAKEGLEIVRSIRDAGWASIPLDPPTVQYCLGLGETALEEMASSGCFIYVEKQFTRTVEFTNDAVCVLPSCRKVMMIVTWPERDHVQSVTLSTYLTNWRGE